MFGPEIVVFVFNLSGDGKFSDEYSPGGDYEKSYEKKDRMVVFVCTEHGAGSRKDVLWIYSK